MMACIWIAWIAIRELIHEKVFYLLAGFAALSLGLSLLFGQLTYAEQAKLTLDFMLGGIEISMLLFSVFMGISLFHRELTSGSISMVLSKPIHRASFLVGKFIGQWLVQAAVILLMGLFTLSVCARFGKFVSPIAVTQTLLMFAFEVSVLSAITYFFAVNSGGITTAVATCCMFLIGHLRTTVSGNLGLGPEVSVWGIVKTFTPDFEIFNMKSLASYGQAIPWSELGWASVYAICCTFFFLLMAAICFQVKDIST